MQRLKQLQWISNEDPLETHYGIPTQEIVPGGYPAGAGEGGALSVIARTGAG
jgi:hypothetical protein